jgi:hypothetical protein
MSFVVIPTAQNSYIGLKASFFLIMPTPKIWCWRNEFYRIESRPRYFAFWFWQHWSDTYPILLYCRNTKHLKFVFFKVGASDRVAQLVFYTVNYCYHLVNLIRLTLSQRDNIKRLPL